MHVLSKEREKLVLSRMIQGVKVLVAKPDNLS